eukprot:CAMPEP_0196799660 /NCGR_PEP_ID=MMETSP1104-20130614/39751_1 /TAXON_ID=33652 /ORGANISM="Cafeteria sp., Strain Caron Lab Isolate" /LENGTH=71 /DNA_ID=CAMNT_0042170069 /DNA_START=566 /DNA_END=781 /DNA_ORIENTATION=+
MSPKSSTAVTPSSGSEPSVSVDVWDAWTVESALAPCGATSTLQGLRSLWITECGRSDMRGVTKRRYREMVA